MKTIDVPVFRTHEYDVVVGGNGINSTIILHNPYHVSNKVLSLSRIGIAVGGSVIDVDYMRGIGANAIGVGLKTYGLSVRRNNEAVEINPTAAGVRIGAGLPRLKGTLRLSSVTSGIGLSTMDMRLGTSFQVYPSTIGIQLDANSVAANSSMALVPATTAVGIEILSADLKTDARIIHYTDSTTESGLALGLGRHHLASAQIGRYDRTMLLFAGGCYYPSSSSSGVTTSSNVDVYSYNLVHSTGTALSTARYGLVGATDMFRSGGTSDGTLYSRACFAGGYAASSYSNVVDVYQYNGTRSTGSTLSTSRGYLAGTTIQNPNVWADSAYSSLIAFFGGGYTGSSTYSKVLDIYHYSTRYLSTSLSTARSLLSAGSVGLYAVFGGGRATTYSDVVDAHSGTGSAVTQPASLYAAADYLATANAGDYLLFAGGYGKVGGSNSNVDSITPYNTTLVRGTELHLPVAMGCHAGTTLTRNGKKYAIFAGGETDVTGVFMDNVAVYNDNLVEIDGNTLSLTTPRGYFVAGTMRNDEDEYAIFAGGESATNTGSGAVDVFKIIG